MTTNIILSNVSPTLQEFYHINVLPYFYPNNYGKLQVQLEHFFIKKHSQ